MENTQYESPMKNLLESLETNFANTVNPKGSLEIEQLVVDGFLANQIKIEYYITFMVRDEEGDNDEYHTIASGIINIRTAIKLAEQTTGYVEIIAQYTFANGDVDDEGENGEYVHIGFIDGEQQYYDEG